ncbi:uracil-DNA glycosylase [Mycoplasma sp. 744]|uniref:uracil-DNA glycosylase n=1 Tax=Mycoplasma sp. 744 TaxID=3108531 RepID=UPI002B1D41A5|nr:uracil-DNA glycosylase [Mycoplasma sp. 744]MEA4115709.1 uracil-DNA glycosylase [Mycoplasma sp. 744]
MMLEHYNNLKIKNSYKKFLNEEFKKEYFVNLINEIKKSEKPVWPTENNWFKALTYCEIQDLKLIIIAQDPYYLPNVADGLAFSSQKEKTPKSLKNIKKEILKDYPDAIFETNSLHSWAKQGVFLWNTIVTVEENKPLSHKNKGWEIFSANLINYILGLNKNLVFLILGNNAKNFMVKYLNQTLLKKIKILEYSHPAPLGYKKTNKAFFNSHCFSQINKLIAPKFIDFSIRKEN